MTSYFEIGGVIVESQTPGDGSSEPPRIFRRSLFESPRIESSRWSMVDMNPPGFSDLKKPHAVAAGGYQDPADEWAVEAVGSMMVRTGAAMLLIPDPLEPVSTPIAAALVIGGVALHATTW